MIECSLSGIKRLYARHDDTARLPVNSLTTTRLNLKIPEIDDVPSIVRAIDDWEVVRWLSRVPFPYREQDAVEFVERTQQCFNDGTAHRFLVVFEEAVVGCVGLDRYEAQIFEIGYWIARRYWGFGIATESVKAVIQFAFDQLGQTQIEASCHEKNFASVRVLQKSGFTQTGYGMRFSTALGKNVREIQFLLEKSSLAFSDVASP